jgi:hypothetical protein
MRTYNVALHTSGKTNTGVGCIVDRIVVLKELLANDEVDATQITTVVDPGIVVAGLKPEVSTAKHTVAVSVTAPKTKKWHGG